jgi:hypothetical protein
MVEGLRLWTTIFLLWSMPLDFWSGLFSHYLIFLIFDCDDAFCVRISLGYTLGQILRRRKRRG